MRLLIYCFYKYIAEDSIENIMKIQKCIINRNLLYVNYNYNNKYQE